VCAARTGDDHRAESAIVSYRKGCLSAVHVLVNVQEYVASCDVGRVLGVIEITFMLLVVGENKNVCFQTPNADDDVFVGRFSPCGCTIASHHQSALRRNFANRIRILRRVPFLTLTTTARHFLDHD
jgi:hypothetical protein